MEDVAAGIGLPCTTLCLREQQFFIICLRRRFPHSWTMLASPPPLLFSEAPKGIQPSWGRKKVSEARGGEGNWDSDRRGLDGTRKEGEDEASRKQKGGEKGRGENYLRRHCEGWNLVKQKECVLHTHTLSCFC